MEGQGQRGGAPAAWHPDPYGGACHRWWDGSSWTEDVGPGEPQFGLAPMRDAAGRSLQLDQGIGSGTDELRDEQGLRFGLMQIPTLGNVTVYAERGTWVLDRQGLTQNALSIRVQPANFQIARFEWQGVGTGTNGHVVFNDGRWFHFLRGEDMDRSRFPGAIQEYMVTAGSWTFLDPAGTAIVTVRLAQPGDTERVMGADIKITTWGTGKTAGNIVADVHSEAVDRRELPLLTLLGVYLVWWTVTLQEQVSRD
jgi:hypothetical protein